jgi:hypothetical protein
MGGVHLPAPHALYTRARARGFKGVRRSTPLLDEIAHVAQLAERVLGKDEVISSILIVGSRLSGA